MPCMDHLSELDRPQRPAWQSAHRRATLAAWPLALLLLGSCATRTPTPAEQDARAGVPAIAVQAAPPTVPSASAASSPPPAPLARNWEDYRLQAAQRIVQANAGDMYTGEPPSILAAIPVLRVQLNADGSVRAIDVLRTPKSYPETVEMAIKAVQRAAPFGAVRQLPRPWQFNETFLYNDELKFQLHTLVNSR